MKTSSTGLSFRVITHNIRYATTNVDTGERPWPERKPRLISELQYSSRHCKETFICLQEVLHNQLHDINVGMNETKTCSDDSWSYIGIGRDDGIKAGEYSPIFYRPAVWNLVTWKTIWLSQTPSVPSKGWDAASYRIVTIGVFKHVHTQDVVTIFNTHFDDQGATARMKSANLILDEASNIFDQVRATIPCFLLLTGDLNSETTEDAYRILTTGGFEDCRDKIDSLNRYGNDNTFTGFKNERGKRIDFILLWKGSDSQESSKARVASSTLAVDGYAVLGNQFEEGIYLSDHRAVVCDVRTL